MVDRDTKPGISGLRAVGSVQGVVVSFTDGEWWGVWAPVETIYDSQTDRYARNAAKNQTLIPTDELGVCWMMTDSHSDSQSTLWCMPDTALARSRYRRSAGCIISAM